MYDDSLLRDEMTPLGVDETAQHIIGDHKITTRTGCQNQRKFVTMMTIRFLHLLLTVFAIASASNTRGGRRDIELHDEDLSEDEKVNRGSTSSDRGLLSLAQCPYLGATVFFNVQTSIIPGTNATVCSDEKLGAIGTMLNSALINAGVATYSGSIFLAGTCDTPTLRTASTVSSLLNGFVRRTLQSGFIWTGGGVSCTDLLVCSCLFSMCFRLTW